MKEAVNRDVDAFLAMRVVSRIGDTCEQMRESGYRCKLTIETPRLIATDVAISLGLPNNTSEDQELR